MVELRIPELISIALYVITALLFCAAWASQRDGARRVVAYAALFVGGLAAVSMFTSYTGSLEVWLDLPVQTAEIGLALR